MDARMAAYEMAQAGERGWDIDFAHGKKGEMTVASIVCGKHEVKRDRASHKTGNVVVEYRYKGQPSGIASTTALWWTFVLDDAEGNVSSVLSVPVERLKSIAAACYRDGRIASGGDNNASDMVLVPVRMLLEWSAM